MANFLMACSLFVVAGIIVLVVIVARIRRSDLRAAEQSGEPRRTFLGDLRTAEAALRKRFESDVQALRSEAAASRIGTSDDPLGTLTAMYQKIRADLATLVPDLDTNAEAAAALKLIQDGVIAAATLLIKNSAPPPFRG